MLNISGLFFVKAWQHAGDGDLNLAGAVWDSITIHDTDPPDGGCQLIVLMQADEPTEQAEDPIELKAWRVDAGNPTVHEMAYTLDGSVSGRNRFGVVMVPAAFFREPGDYAVTAALGNRAPTAYLRISVVAGR